jgi:hypothetical protein
MMIYKISFSGIQSTSLKSRSPTNHGFCMNNKTWRDWLMANAAKQNLKEAAKKIRC